MILSGIEITKAQERYREVRQISKSLENSDPDWEREQGERARWALEDLQQQPLILLEPFNKSQLNPNSFNLRLAPELLVYDLGPLSSLPNMSRPLDPKKDNPTLGILINEEGFMLKPGFLYLGKTVEFTESWNCVPSIDGRSSLGRLGMSIHITAGFGDVGFCGNWTLEITVIHPTIVYANMECCQISYQTVSKEHENYKGKYLGDRKPRASAMHEEFDDGDDSNSLDA